MARLALPVAQLRPEYDAVVVGSGYGGGVAASRLARMGLSVAVLERGREILPGEFPSTLLAAQRDLQITAGSRRIGAATALFDLRMGKDVHALVGCGLGGTSLINANVCLNPDVLVMQDEVWPQPVRADHYLNVGFHRAREMLAPVPLPATSTPLKLAALEAAAHKAFGREVERVPLHIAFADQINRANVLQPACTECGDCMGGCNVGAKTTVHSTYLADAANHGADIFTNIRVRFVERTGDGRWRAVFLRPEAEGKIVPLRDVTARMVIIAAGTLGSNEILMRSRDRGLKLSARLGERVSTNADVIAFGYNNEIPVNAIGIGHPPRPNIPRPGPAVCGLIDLRRRSEPDARLAIVEASVQSAMAAVMPLMLPGGAKFGTDTDKGLEDLAAELQRTAESALQGPYTGAVHNTQVFLAVGNDSAAGVIRLEGDQVTIHWPDALKEPVFKAIDAALMGAVAATGGTYIPNPVSHRFLGSNLFTVHPLGGCAMAMDRAAGVVDHRCRVFDGDPAKGADAVHEGLFVCDGSVMPRPVGVHPLLTITAVAERAMLLLAKDLRRPLDVAPKSDAPLRDFRASASAPPRPGLIKRLVARARA